MKLTYGTYVLLVFLLLLVFAHSHPEIIDNPVDNGNDLTDMALIPEELLPQYKETLPVNSDISFHVAFGIKRRKRAMIVKALGSAVSRGYAAAKKLLDGSIRVLPPKNKKLREFVKPGDYNKALKDFESVRPYDVQKLYGPQGVVRRVGHVGDRTIILTRDKFQKKRGRQVTLEIIKSKYLDSGIDRITYTNSN